MIITESKILVHLLDKRKELFNLRWKWIIKYKKS